LYGWREIEASGWRNCLRRKIGGVKNYFGVAGNFGRLTAFLINSQAKMPNNTAQINVCHHGPIGIGNRMKSSHLRQPRFFHQRDGSLLAFFAAGSIAGI
jgi:hypothetical protein